MKHPITARLGAALTAVILVCSFSGRAWAGEGLGIQQASKLCNGEHEETSDQIIEGCTRVLQYGNAAFGGVKYAYVNRGYAYRDKGQCELALADFNKAISLRADKPRHYRGRATVFLCLKRYDEALADLNSAIEKDPADAWSYLYRGRVYLAKGDRAHAQTDFDRAAKLDPDLAETAAKELAT